MAYFFDDTNELVAIDKTAPTVPAWVFQGTAGASQGYPAAITQPSFTLTARTEASLDADGTLYFGDTAGKVYAIVTDSPAAVATSTNGLADWPKTGYDNCNSASAGNQWFKGFVCR
jgi:hypothetical protein